MFILFILLIINEKPIYISNINIIINQLIEYGNDFENQNIIFSTNHCFYCRNIEYAEELTKKFENKNIYINQLKKVKDLNMKL